MGNGGREPGGCGAVQQVTRRRVDTAVLLAGVVGQGPTEDEFEMVSGLMPGASYGRQAAVRMVGGSNGLAGGQWPGGDVLGMAAGGHAGVRPSACGRRVLMWAACRLGVKICQPVLFRSGRAVAWWGQSWARQRCCSPAGARVRS